jgi:hypothetical protein
MEKETIVENLIDALAALTDDLDENSKKTGDKNAYLVSTLIKAYGAVECQKLAIELQKFEALEEIMVALKDMQK